MRKVFIYALFFYVLGAGAMEALPQEWGAQEMKNLAGNENVKQRLLKNGIERYLCNAMMSEDDIKTILSEFTEGTFLTRSCDLQQYLQSHLRKLVQVEFLQKIATSIRDGRRFEVHLTRRMSKYDVLSTAPWYKPTFLLKDLESKEKAIAKVFFMLPRSLQSISRRHLAIIEATHWKVWCDRLKKIF